MGSLSEILHLALSPLANNPALTSSDGETYMFGV
jgi:hypothetical protein